MATSPTNDLPWAPLKGTDDSGASVSLGRFTPSTCPDLRPAPAAAAIAAFRASVARSRVPPGSAILFTLGFCIACLLGLALMIACLYGAGQWEPVHGLVDKKSLGVLAWLPVAFVPPGILVAIVGRVIDRSRRAAIDHFASLVLQLQRCPACGEPIPTEPPSDPGERVACVCGAEWRRERIGETGVPSSTNSVDRWRDLAKLADSLGSRM